MAMLANILKPEELAKLSADDLQKLTATIDAKLWLNPSVQAEIQEHVKKAHEALLAAPKQN